jgi:hypothetical protein
MKHRVTCLTENFWYEAVEYLEKYIASLKTSTKCTDTKVDYDVTGIEKSPCTSQLWKKCVGIEHDEYTCYFRHWFRNVDGSLQTCRFSHLAMMPLIRSCVWQGLLAEFVTDKLLGREAVRLRVENELEHYSNLSSLDLRCKIGILAQDFFGVIKNYLKATDKPLTKSALGAAEKIVVNTSGADYRNARKGWSNREERKNLAQQIIDSGIAELKTRREQEMFIWGFFGDNATLKQDSPKAVLRLLTKYIDIDTGECVIKRWSKEEIRENCREVKLKANFERTSKRVFEVCKKIKNGQKLSNADRQFKFTHKELFVEKMLG